MENIRIAVGVGGEGKFFKALVHACEVGIVPATVVNVFGYESRTGQLYTKSPIQGESILMPGFSELKAIREYGEVDLVCLDHYPKMLEEEVVAAFKGKILCAFPSPLEFAGPGLWGRRAIEARLRFLKATMREFVTCATVYLLGSGKVVAEDWMEVYEGDTCNTLAARLYPRMRDLYLEAILIWMNPGMRGEGGSLIARIKGDGRGIALRGRSRHVVYPQEQELLAQCKEEARKLRL